MEDETSASTAERSRCSQMHHVTNGCQSLYSRLYPLQQYDAWITALQDRKTACTFVPGTNAISLLILFFFSLLDDLLKNSLRVRRFKSDRDEIWQNCSSNEKASIVGTGFRKWRLTFNMAAMTSWHAKRYALCVVTSERALQLWSAARRCPLTAEMATDFAMSSDRSDRMWHKVLVWK